MEPAEGWGGRGDRAGSPGAGLRMAWRMCALPAPIALRSVQRTFGSIHPHVHRYRHPALRFAQIRRWFTAPTVALAAFGFGGPLVSWRVAECFHAQPKKPTRASI